MSLFKDSASVQSADVYDKILFWGPQGVGKTHTAMSWPEPAFIDREGARALHFRDRFRFFHTAPKSIAELAAAFKELRGGSAPGKTIVVDSATAIYYDFILAHTKASDNGAVVTDWVTVNRRFLACMDFAFGVTDKNVIFTAHQAEKLIRNGRDFTKAGLKFIGDDRFRFAFDYIFRIESKGDPRSVPAVYHVEKSASPNLKIGQQIVGLDHAKFIELTRVSAKPLQAVAPLKGEALADAQTRGDVPSESEPITQTQANAIVNLAKNHHLDSVVVDAVVKDCTRGRTTDYQKITSAEAAHVIRRLPQLRTAGAA